MFDVLIENYATLSPAELDAAIADAELSKRIAETRLAAAAAVISARGSFRDGGHRSMRSYLKSTLNCSGAVANRIRRRAALVNQHPDVGEALVSGRAGVEQVDRLASAAAHPRVGERFGEFAPLLLDHAEQLEFDDFTTVVDHFVTHADPDGAFDDQQFHADHRRQRIARQFRSGDRRSTAAHNDRENAPPGATIQDLAQVRVTPNIELHQGRGALL